MMSARTAGVEASVKVHVRNSSSSIDWLRFTKEISRGEGVRDVEVIGFITLAKEISRGEGVREVEVIGFITLIASKMRWGFCLSRVERAAAAATRARNAHVLFPL